MDANILAYTEDMEKDEWLNIRKQGIGGSDCSVICGLNQYKSPVALWMEKTGQIEPQEAGETVYWGIIMEPIIRKEFSLRTNLKVRLAPFMLKHPVYDFMIADLDGIVDDPVYSECVFEAKTSSVFRRDEWEDDKIPEEYMLQIQHYMAVTGSKRTYIAVLLGGNQFKYKAIERDDDLIGMIIKLEEHFWKCVKEKTPPEMDGTEASTELLNRLYPASTKKQILLPPEAGELINQYVTAKAREKEESELKDEASNKLKSLLGENETGIYEDNIISWKSISAEKFDSKKLQDQEPEIYKKYLNKSSYRRFTVK